VREYDTNNIYSNGFNWVNKAHFEALIFDVLTNYESTSAI
jgi:hypothetical protein